MLKDQPHHEAEFLESSSMKVTDGFGFIVVGSLILAWGLMDRRSDIGLRPIQQTWLRAVITGSGIILVGVILLLSEAGAR
jgi:hypothetical protein